MFFIVNLIFVLGAGMMVLVIAATSSLPNRHSDATEAADRA